MIMTTKTNLSADWADNRIQENEHISDNVDRDLLLHYIYKSILNGNHSCPFDNSMEKCLDIGYSSGYWMMEMATDFPNCQFYGIDIDPNVPELVYPKNCFFGQGDYLKALPYEDNSFDVVHLRSLSTLGNSTQISFLLSEVYRVTKKGGYVQYEFFGPNSDPLLSPILGKLMKIYSNNTMFNCKMDRMLVESGFVNVTDNKVVSLPLVRGSMVGEFSLAALKNFIETMDVRTKSKLDLRGDEDNLQYLLERECKQYNVYINVFSGYGQK
uniref:Demethylmenaquinone methyltransferase n=1 Tax=Anthurium amnicola TaxID=1678845 RepID=A0A1D1XJ36_9ARAE